MFIILLAVAASFLMGLGVFYCMQTVCILHRPVFKGLFPPTLWRLFSFCLCGMFITIVLLMSLLWTFTILPLLSFG